MTLDKLKSMKKNIKIITENCNATIFFYKPKTEIIEKTNFEYAKILLSKI